MKILAVLPDNILNRSVHEMMEAARDFGQENHPSDFQLDIAMQPFWTAEKMDYDIVHIHWPEALFDWEEVSKEDVDKLEKRLIALKEQGVKIVVTRHNTIPHRKALYDALLYHKTFEYTDAVFHMERFSYQDYLRMYHDYEWSKQQQHYFAPIIQYTRLANTTSRAAARQKLGIAADKFVYMTLGSIRNNEERKLIEKIAKELKGEDMLYIAQWPYYGSRPILSHWRKLRTKMKYRNHHFQPNAPIADDDMQDYLNACDVLISPRMDSLNSGLISLGFSFGKTVLGPATGNMEAILKQTGNATYDPYDLSSLDKSLQGAKDAALNGKGKENLIFAQTEWSWQRVGQLHVDAYKKILN
jgi:glycosyltransferase involved in cell wall biosynthesis